MAKRLSPKVLVLSTSPADRPGDRFPMASIQQRCRKCQDLYSIRRNVLLNHEMTVYLVNGGVSSGLFLTPTDLRALVALMSRYQTASSLSSNNVESPLNHITNRARAGKQPHRGSIVAPPVFQLTDKENVATPQNETQSQQIPRNVSIYVQYLSVASDTARS